MLTISSAPVGHQLLDGVVAVQALRPEVGVVPDVLADRHAQAAAAEQAQAHRRSRARSSATRRTRRRWAAATCGATDTHAARRQTAPRCWRCGARWRCPGRRSGKPTRTATGASRAVRAVSALERPARRLDEGRAAPADPAADTRTGPARGTPADRRRRASARRQRLRRAARDCPRSRRWSDSIWASATLSLSRSDPAGSAPAHL